MDQSEEQFFELVARHLARSRGIDLMGYSPSFVMRAVKKRMGRSRSRDYLTYLALLRRSEEETDAFVGSLSINVTEFFRDKGAFETLAAKVIRPLLAEKNTPVGGILRIWSAGCATGQETYTLSMCIEEEVRRLEGDLKMVISVLGTDLSESAVAYARNGIYKPEELKGVSDRRLKQYFTKVDGCYQICDPIRRRVRFGTGNLLARPEATHFDAVICRNVLIYFSRPFHDTVLMNLHGALRVGGYLMIGKTETLMGMKRDLFETVDSDCRIYRKNP